MGEVLVLGLSHFPMLSTPDASWGRLFRRLANDPRVPDELRDPASWPAGLRAEWADDDGLAAAAAHRKALVEDFRRVRGELEAFDPDYVVVWGDDQYENYQDDTIPPFSILAYDNQVVRPWLAADGQTVPNAWSESSDFEVEVRIDRTAAKALTSALLDEGFDMTYAYRPLHKVLSHAFLNTVLFVDYDRVGFPWPIVPFHVNCYGRRVVAQRGGVVGLSDEPAAEDLDPPSPAPWRCFDLGAACARFAAAGSARVALVASASWSHAFLTRKHHYLWPDIDADRELFADLAEGQYDSWRRRTLAEVEDSGQQEILNWVCVTGALAELGLAPRYANFHECWAFNSPKVFLIAGGQ